MICSPLGGSVVNWQITSVLHCRLLIVENHLLSQKAKKECVAGEPGLFALELLNFITPPGKWAALISKTIGLAHL